MSRKRFYEIQHNIPVPEKRGRWWPLISKMKHGDSILLPSRKEATKFAQTVQANHPGFRARQRVQRDGTHRVWLLAMEKK